MDVVREYILEFSIKGSFEKLKKKIHSKKLSFLFGSEEETEALFYFTEYLYYLFKLQDSETSSSEKRSIETQLKREAYHKRIRGIDIKDYTYPIDAKTSLRNWNKYKKFNPQEARKLIKDMKGKNI